MRRKSRWSLAVRRSTPQNVRPSLSWKNMFARSNRLTSKRKKRKYEASESSHRCGAKEKGQARRRASRRVVEDCICRLHDSHDGVFPGDVADFYLQSERRSEERRVG